MKKLLCALMASFIALSVFASCNKTDESSDIESSAVLTEGSQTQSDADTSDDEEKPYGWDLPVKDMNGRVINILCRDWAAGSNSILGYNGEVIQRPDYGDLGIIIEALGAASKNSVTPVYYEKCMKSQYVRDEEDEEMLDIIFDSRCFDLGSVFNWGGVLSQFMTIDVNYASRFDAIVESAQAALDETLEYFRD